MELVPILILSLFGIVIIGFLVYVVMRFVSRSKVSLEVKLSNSEVVAGGEVSGEVSVDVKKPLHDASLEVGVVCLEHDRRRGSDGHYRSSNRELYSFYKPLTKKGYFGVGKSTLPFSVVMPSHASSAAPSGVLGGALKAAQFFVGGSNISWHVVLRMNMPGVDVVESKQVNVGSSVPKAY